MVPLLTQLLLQGLDERVLALLAEGTSEIIQVQGPDHGPSQSLLFQIADLGGMSKYGPLKYFLLIVIGSVTTGNQLFSFQKFLEQALSSYLHFFATFRIPERIYCGCVFPQRYSEHREDCPWSVWELTEGGLDPLLVSLSFVGPTLFSGSIASFPTLLPTVSSLYDYILCFRTCLKHASSHTFPPSP